MVYDHNNISQTKGDDLVFLQLSSLMQKGLKDGERIGSCHVTSFIYHHLQVIYSILSDPVGLCVRVGTDDLYNRHVETYLIVGYRASNSNQFKKIS